MAKQKIARQKIIVELSNGKKGVFEGTAIAWPDDIEEVAITNVIFTVPTLGNPKNVTPAPTPPPAPAPTPPPTEAPKA